MVSENIIEEIRNKTDIVSVVSEYVQLKKRGKNYLGLCPFHSEKTASFTVSPEKQIFHCFGCHEGGNVFTFLMKIENISFGEALAELGTKSGVSLPKPEKASATKNEQDQIYPVMQIAAKFFEANLLVPGNLAIEYLSARGIATKTCQMYALGYSLPEWDSLFKHLIAKGVPPLLMEKCGLVLPREGQANSYYDRFRNRLMIPIRDQRGRIIAFGGRSIGSDEPKYLNSPESPVYHKSEVLFGLDMAKESIKKTKTAILVEGYFDQITPFQSGISNVVATSGTALTPMHCKILSRYAENAILTFDSDTAGNLAAEKSTELLQSLGIKVKIAQIKGAKDPDELVQKNGQAGFLACLENALPYLEFKIQRIGARSNLKEIESRSKALQEIAALLSTEKDVYVQKEYAKKAATLLKTDLDTVMHEIKCRQNYRENFKTTRKSTTKPQSRIEEAEKNLIALAVQDQAMLQTIKAADITSCFTTPEAREIITVLLTSEAAKAENLTHYALDNLHDEGAKKLLSAILLLDHLGEEENKASILKDCLETIKEEKQKIKIASLKSEIQAAENAGNISRSAELISLLKSEISANHVR
ncbi:MAG: DNA primase [Candidatus Margulisiibacteriota bacterium]